MSLDYENLRNPVHAADHLHNVAADMWTDADVLLFLSQLLHRNIPQGERFNYLFNHFTNNRETP